ncbi:MAG: hypothetical protein MRY63_04340 [Neomegalonema sp.]|nr:hypothetical protein [Neomegalonema sp.]
MIAPIPTHPAILLEQARKLGETIEARDTVIEHLQAALRRTSLERDVAMHELEHLRRSAAELRARISVLEGEA